MNINGFEIHLTRKRIKNLYIRISRYDGSINVSAPMKMPIKKVEEFIILKSDWIIKAQNKIKAKNKEEIFNTKTKFLYLWGEKYPLITKNSDKKSYIIKQNDNIILNIKYNTSDEKINKIITEFYRYELKSKALPYLEHWSNATGLKYNSWQTKSMKTRWGTCNIKTKKIWLNVNLAIYPEKCLEYVVLHELAHILISNHGVDFKAYLSKYMPDWKSRKDILNKGF